MTSEHPTTSMRDDLIETISKSTLVVIGEFVDGTTLTKQLDQPTCEKIADAVLAWMKGVPYEGFAAERYERGDYSRGNVAAMIDDIEDDA